MVRPCIITVWRFSGEIKNMMIKRFWYIVIAIIALGIESCGGSSPDVPPGDGDSPPYAVRAVNSMVKVTPIMDMDEFPTYIKIEGARGEHEAFQVMPLINDPERTIHNLRIEIHNLINGEQIISKENITLFYEYYVKVTEPSDKGGRVGYWPDALIPLKNPFDVSASFPSPVWVDVNIPVDASPGLYKGKLGFKTSDAGDYLFEYALEVWDITFPKKKYIKANFGLDQEDIKRVHGLNEDIASPAGREISRKYARYLADRHISTNCLPIIQPVVALKPDRRGFLFDFTEMEKDIKTFLDEYDLASFIFPLNRFDLYPTGCIGQGEAIFTSDFNARFIDYVEQASQYLADRGYLDRCFAQFIDEPYSFEQYEFIRDIDDVLKQARIKPAHMVPEQPKPDNPEFGSLLDYVDVFVMAVTVLRRDTEALVREGAENKEEWIYTNAAVWPYPSIAIDKQGIETRLFVWFAYQHDFQGIFYSSVSDWSTVNPWENPLTFGHGMGNGCNCLLYPGIYCDEYTHQGDVDGPVGSIRLELTRDGIEDAQLLYILGQGAPVEEANVLMTDWNNYSSDPVELLRIRSEIAQLIMNNK